MCNESSNNDPLEQPRKSVVSFAPSDPTDSRSPGNWKTRYVPEARKLIRNEAIYVGVIFVLVPLGIITTHQDFFGNLEIPRVVKKYTYAWLGGCLGGILFCTKWLYHSVARNVWNQDRLLWRVFTPHISGALSFSFILLISSGIVNLFSPAAMEKNSAVLGIAFLIGYFSDSAIAKLTEIANTVFGATQKSASKRQDS